MIGRATQFLQAGAPQAIAVGEILIRGLILTPAAAAVSVDIKENGTGGTVRLSIAAPANGPSTYIRGPIAIKDPFISAFAGAGGSLTVVM